MTSTALALVDPEESTRSHSSAALRRIRSISSCSSPAWGRGPPRRPHLRPRGDRVAVDVVDLPALAVQFLARSHQFVAGRNDADARLRPDRHLIDAQRGQEADVSRCDHGPGTERAFTRGDVCPREHDVVAGCDRGADQHLVAVCVRISSLHRNHRVGSVGHHRAGRNLCRLSRLESHVGFRAGVDLADELEASGIGFVRAEGVPCPEGVAVEARPVEPRHVEFGVESCDEHPTASVLERDALDAALERERVDRPRGPRRERRDRETPCGS